MTAREKLADLVGTLVVPDRTAARERVDHEAIARTLSTLLAGGKEALVGLIDLLQVPGKGDDSKVRYALHALAIRVSAARDRSRTLYVEALASTLGSKRPAPVQAFVVRQLQVAGGAEAVPALGKLLGDEELAEPATQALVAIRHGAAETLRAALPKSRGKARLHIVHALGTLGDRDSAAQLRKLVRERDQDIRLTALWALANTGDADSVDVLLAATAAEGYERIKAASACLLLAERLRSAGKQKEAQRLSSALSERFSAAHEAHIRAAALRGLAEK